MIIIFFLYQLAKQLILLKLINQKFAFYLDSKPFPTCIIYLNKNKKLMTISVNVHLIIEKEIDKKPESSIIYANKFFRDFLIFVNIGVIYYFFAFF